MHNLVMFCNVKGGIFLDLASSEFKNEQKLPKMEFIIPNFLVLHFNENLMKIRTKIAKLQIHEYLHKNVNEDMFSFTFLCKFPLVLRRAIKATNILQLYAANFHLKWRSSSFRLQQFFPILMVSKIQQAPGPDFRKVGKSLQRCPFSCYAYRKCFKIFEHCCLPNRP